MSFFMVSAVGGVGGFTGGGGGGGSVVTKRIPPPTMTIARRIRKILSSLDFMKIASPILRS